MRGCHGCAPSVVSVLMKVYRDLAYVQTRKRIATLSSVAGVALLGSAFWLASMAGPSGVFLAYLPLLAGTVIFHLGMQQVGKWNRAQRNDVILDGLLKDLGERFTLIHYAKVDKKTIEHVVIHPGGVLAIVARDLPGGVAYANGRWRKVSQGFSRLFGMGGAYLGNPTNDANGNVEALNSLLENVGLKDSADAVVAFLNPRVTLEIEEPEFPVTNAEGLKPYISSLPPDMELRPQDRQAVVEALTAEGSFEAPQATPTRRPVKRRVA
jgi:hypothetical protein